MSDLISRQAAIDALARTAREKFNLSDEFSHYLAGLMDGETAIRQLPSAEQEIIRCRDCKHHDGIRCFRWNSTIITGFDDYCSNAEKRGEENE